MTPIFANFYEELTYKMDLLKFMKSNEEFVTKMQNRDRIEAIQLKRFRTKFVDKFDAIVTKIVTKYESDGYYYRHMNKGVEPPNDLYHFLYRYAEEYGKDVFGAYLVHDYTFEQIHGQGTVIKITKNI